ncbi:fructose-specific PTS transporter subunit EIIC [Enterococcus sp. BWT-B8]|uniref:PTS fructose transporter subunit IIABC n=1 Tax=unclassified Enterococcus TaxID=2608891 RepID=UPI001E3EAAB3|nr:MULTISPECIES: fructose-specific PTS transporter subunit EIIC [unclassified Enterococcus]MCB5952302.1 fructose-specific PTS transporter subunit EIIC [Enterococcus sp. BWT-B8]MCB5955469.1 fructose-specific PTS transporter subunit EIIC [Enterococcus sp. CWB-B31]
MDIKDLLIKDVMIMDLQATDKQEAIDEMVAKMYAGGRISDIQTYKEGILAREAQTSTGLGDGIAMPHAKNNAVKEATVLFAKSRKGIDYESLDGQPVYLFFMIAAPEGANDTHLQALAALSKLLVNPDFVAQLKNAKTPEQVQELFQSAEQKRREAEQQEQALQASPKAGEKFIVAVTACPTGIAHTYMAEDALKKKAKEMGIEIKVETNGSEGIKNKLTAEEIARADGVIVAADKKVEMNRFNGKNLVNRPVSDGIRKPEELIDLAVSGNAPVFHGKNDGSHSAEDDAAEGSVGSRIYKDLMNGVSHMLPFVIGGGIAIALSFMIDQFLGVPQDQLASLGSYNEAASWFNQIGSAAFGFMLPVLAGFIASSIADRPGLIVGFAAGALANTGGAGFLGALIGGFLAGYVIVLLKKLFRNLPKSLDGIKTILFYPVFGLLITGAAMLLINIPMKVINDGLNSFLLGLDGTNAALLGALLAGMMAVDLGGPINKAAYVFGTASIATSLTEGGSVIMAAVMAGGMVPPLAIFIATLLFKNKFTQDQKDAGLTNLIMGLSFVTEGAIPFAAADPLRVIPGFIVGSALTGALVGGMGIRLLAPHGGIFVALLLNNPIMYLLFIAVGALVSAIVVGSLKKSVIEVKA